MTDLDIGINDFRRIDSGYSLHINGNLVRDKIPSMYEVLLELKKYLRLRFREPIK